MSADLDSNVLGYIADAVSKGECNLFLGAGVHFPPPETSDYTYPDAHRPPLGSELSLLLAEKCDFANRFPKESPSNLQRVSLCYETQHSRKQLVQEIEASVHTGKSPSPVLCALATLGFPVVITTNFDKLVEQALTKAGRDPWISVYSPDPHRETADYPRFVPIPDNPLVLKIHGDVGYPESMVITDEDYIDFILRMQDKQPYKPVPPTVDLCLSKWMTLFVGYSFFDYNLRLLFKFILGHLDPAKRPVVYSVDIHPDPLILAVLQRQQGFVIFLVEDVWTFAPRLFRRVLGKEMPHFCA